MLGQGEECWKKADCLIDVYKAVAFLLCSGADRRFCSKYLLPKIVSKAEMVQSMLDGESAPAELQQWMDIVQVWLQLSSETLSVEDAEQLVQTTLIPIGEHQTSAAYYLLTVCAMLQVDVYRWQLKNCSVTAQRFRWGYQHSRVVENIAASWCDIWIVLPAVI